MAQRALSTRTARFFSRGLVSALSRTGGCRGIVFDVESDQEFEDKVKGSNKAVLVDFHASWCGPCKDLGPKLITIADKFEAIVDLAKVDVDEMQELAMEYNVTAVPTVLGMKDGKVVDQFVGSKDEQWLEDFTTKLSSSS